MIISLRNAAKTSLNVVERKVKDLSKANDDVTTFIIIYGYRENGFTKTIFLVCQLIIYTTYV